MTCALLHAGRQCNVCSDGFNGLSTTNVDGCQPCNCYSGNSLSQSCDQITGQCRCIDYTTGSKTCDLCPDGFYSTNQGYKTYSIYIAEIFVHHHTTHLHV